MVLLESLASSSVGIRGPRGSRGQEPQANPIGPLQTMAVLCATSTAFPLPAEQPPSFTQCLLFLTTKCLPCRGGFALRAAVQEPPPGCLGSLYFSLTRVPAKEQLRAPLGPLLPAAFALEMSPMVGNQWASMQDILVASGLCLLDHCWSSQGRRLCSPTHPTTTTTSSTPFLAPCAQSPKGLEFVPVRVLMWVCCANSLVAAAFGTTSSSLPPDAKSTRHLPM
ncbi:Hypothetical predicted protein [Podarcis lilfordi]|uniref:Uncharacterized protein n=1 Tax=Podarcis lilfordi TaxID=74358 RepID=A0AA35KRU1_9SAUR|nr:Hypothetical predicted protein [Podarcis lilfordi]